jgi:hypothetical protein
MPYSHHPYAYALGNPVLYSDPAGTYAVDPSDGGGATNPCARITDPQAAFLCNYNRRTQGTGAEPGQEDDNTYECIGNPGAVEVRLPLAGGGTAPACLTAPQTEFEQWVAKAPRKPKQPTFIIDSLGNLVCADDGSDSEEPAQLGQSSFLPGLGIPPPPGWLKKLRRGLDGFLRPNTLRNPKTWQEAEDMIAAFTGVKANRKPQTRIPVPGAMRRRAPDFVAPDWLGESKFLDDTPEFNLGIQQKDVAKIAMDKLHIRPYYVFITEGKPIDSKLVRLLRDTGGDIIIFFKQP